MGPQIIRIPGQYPNNIRKWRIVTLTRRFLRWVKRHTFLLKRKSRIYPQNISKGSDNKVLNNSSFRRSIGVSLGMARFLGLFPVSNLSGPSSRISFNPRSILAIASAASALPSLWIVFASLYHASRALSRAKAGKSGGFANETAGAVFYGNAVVAAVLLRSVARGWPTLIQRWREEEHATKSPLPPLRKKLNIVAFVVLSCALLEHLLSIATQTPDCRGDVVHSTLSGCFEEYCMRSHRFVFETVGYSATLGVFIFFVSKVATFAWNFQDLLLIQVSIGLIARFRHVNTLLENIDYQTVVISDWKRMRELFAGTAGLARETSTLFAPLVLLSFTNNLYFICLQMLNGLSPSDDGVLHLAYFFGSFGFMVARVTCVALAAAAIPLEARRSLPVLRCCPARAYCAEVQRICQQLVHDEITLSGMGFFSVNRNFMLGVAGAIATYEVVLLQFDTPDEPASPKPTLLSIKN